MTRRTQLFEAVGENDIDQLRKLLAIPHSEEGYEQLLSIAVTHNFPEIVTLLLEHKANPNYITSEKCKETLLFSAVRSSSIPLITTLFQHQADPNIQNDEGKTVLHSRVNVADEASVKLLLENKADPNILDNKGNTPIFYARTAAIFKLLLEHNTDIDLHNKAGDSVRALLENSTLSNYNSHLRKALNDYQMEQLQNIKVADEGIGCTALDDKGDLLGELLNY